MWQQINLLGRDKLLQKEIYPRALGKKPPFLLVGPRGIGKTAILEWAFETATGLKAFISCTWTVREIMIAICKSWNLSLDKDGKALSPDRATVSALEQAIMKIESAKIFIDDVQQATPALLRRLKIWRERFSVYICGVPPFNREELRRNLWGLKEITIQPLSEQHRKKLSEKICIHLGSNKSPAEIAQASRGYPARIVAMAKGEIETTSHRVQGEELDFSPILLLLVAGFVALRYIGSGLGESDLYLIGGVGTAVLLFLRFFISKGMA